MITFAKDKYIPAIKALWKSAFGDTDESCNYYFENLHKHENMLVYVDGDDAVAMLTMLPLKISCGKQKYSARYVFAVATHENYRSQGISSRLIEYAHDYMRKSGINFSVLVPASESLFDFYANRGYERMFSVSKKTVNACKIATLDGEFSIEKCDAEEYYKLRSRAFENNTPFAFWEGEMLSKIIDYMRFCGCEFYKIQTDSGIGAAFVYAGKTEASVKELALCGIDEGEALAILHSQIGAEKYTVIASPKGNGNKGFAMIYSICGKKIEPDRAYFNIALD